MDSAARSLRLTRYQKKVELRLLNSQKWRLISGLGVFGLLVLSQMFRGLGIEIVAILGFFPLFLFFYKKSRSQQQFFDKINNLKDFYDGHQEFQKGGFVGNTSPEDMANPDLARDLDLHHLFSYLDKCFTDEGSQKLNQLLCQVFEDSSFEDRRQKIKALTAHPGLLRRLHIQPQSSRVRLSQIKEELQRPFLESVRPWMFLIPVCWLGLYTLALPLGLPSIIWKLLLLGYFGTLLAFFSHTQFLFSRLQDLEKDFQHLNQRLKILETLASKLNFTPGLKEHLASQDLVKLGRLIALASIRTNPILFYVINFIFPLDFFVTLQAEKERRKINQHFSRWNEEIIDLEALSCFANLTHYQPTQWPEPNPQVFVSAKGMRHPLLNLQTGVTNDFDPGDNKVILVTGSNMSGKSTFLRAIGMNFCLAQAGAPVFAESFQFAAKKIMTCIRVSDSLRDGQSYFYAEVQRLKKIAQQARRGSCFFLIDEPLRGTNNRERFIGNSHYLKDILKHQACGFLCTHDLEMTQLEDSFEVVRNHHFGETWQDQKLFFDYKIKEGPSTTTNALKILAQEGLYPPDLV